jgi:hypothetical protein
MAKKIIKRHLPLDVKYTCTDKKYISLIDGMGCTCDNCGRLISNIATVKSENGVYNIGFDCLETFLLNNNLLDGFNINEYEQTKKYISQIIRISKKLKYSINANKHINITGLLFNQPPTYKTSYWGFYWLQNNDSTSRDNDYIKIKDMDFDFMIETLRNIFPKMQILVTTK